MIKNKYSTNSDDIFLRYLTAGISETLSDAISYYQIESDTVTTIKKVPVLLEGTGQERFLQYYFNDKNHEVCEQTLEGSYDVVPRGVISYKGNGLETSNNTAPKVRGDLYEVDENGYIRMYNAYIQGIPLKISVTFEITCNTIGEQYKIWQSLIKTLYYTTKFKFIFEGCVVPCMIAYPDDVPLEKLYEFKTGPRTSDKRLLRTTLDIETYLPIITDKRFKGNRIEKFETNINISPNEEDVELLETYYDGIISGRITYIEDDKPLTGNIVLSNSNDTNSDNDVTAILDDGYFAFHDIKARTGYIIKDDNGNTIERKIHLEPNETLRLDLSVYNITD